MTRKSSRNEAPGRWGRLTIEDSGLKRLFVYLGMRINDSFCGLYYLGRFYSYIIRGRPYPLMGEVDETEFHQGGPYATTPFAVRSKEVYRG
jgi:hypothetical protein